MKTTYYMPLLLILFSFSTFAQDKTTTAKVTGLSFTNPNKKLDKPQGSPYNQITFSAAKINDIPQKYYMRYDVYDDVFEFITPKNDTLVIDKIEAFDNIVFTATFKNYVLASYTNSYGKLIYGYLVHLYTKNDFVLYAKENVTFYEEKVAKTTLERDMPAKFVKSDDTYFLRTKNNGIVEFPDSKKRLLKLFPENKEALESFLKENKISFDEASDRIKIVDFLATL